MHLRESDPLGAVHSVGSNLGTLIQKEMDPDVFIGVGRRSITALSKFNYGRIQCDCPFSLKFNMFPDEVYLWRQTDPTKWTAPSGSLSPAAVLSPRKALRTSIKSQLWKISSTFGDKYPQNGSKNGLRAPRTGMGCPHEGPSVDLDECLAQNKCSLQTLQVVPRS